MMSDALQTAPNNSGRIPPPAKPSETLGQAVAWLEGVPDIWGSAFAVWLGVATDEQSRRIAGYFREHYDELVIHGQVRHIPGFTDWDGNRVAENGGDYQSGAFWATPVGWFVFTLDRVDPALADRTVLAMVRHFQRHGANEGINAKECRLAGYLASAALPLVGIRDMAARRRG